MLHCAVGGLVMTVKRKPVDFPQSVIELMNIYKNERVLGDSEKLVFGFGDGGIGIGRRLLESLGDDVEFTFDDAFEIVPGFSNAVVGDAVLGIVIGADFFAAHTTANGLTGFSKFGDAFIFLNFPKFG